MKCYYVRGKNVKSNDAAGFSNCSTSIFLLRLTSSFGYVHHSYKYIFFFSVGVHVMVQDVNEFAPKWNIRSEDIANEPLHTLTTGVAIEEGQLFEEVSAKIRKKCNSRKPQCMPPWLKSSFKKIFFERSGPKGACGPE